MAHHFSACSMIHQGNIGYAQRLSSECTGTGLSINALPFSQSVSKSTVSKHEPRSPCYRDA